ncbi:MAG TPA: T9SS type A sorting domain-containing protein, partial [Cytophagales bacterium]|nr:T9SS type A sorting domain-containing protein [Cytophagales bacterium]
CRSLRTGLYSWFLTLNGTNIRLNAFKYYKTLGHDQITLFLNEPHSTEKDSVAYKRFKECNPEAGESFFPGMFKDIYEPIWVTQNGQKSVNPLNTYANYVYTVVSTYGPYIDMYEVWNEPDYVSSQVYPKQNPADYNVVEKWAIRDPHPCEMINMYAPIETYVRLMRITWEIVKFYDPTARVCTGGLGYPTFLDAALRNTDNPADGAVSEEYPKKGGAYFDVLSYHAYPQWQLSYWDVAANGFKYRRHSDAAADSAIIGDKRGFENVLSRYGYNGTTFPKKHFIITEVNIPRYTPGEIDYANNKIKYINHIGSPEAQRNFTIKTIVKALMNDIKQLYFFRIGDAVDDSDVSINLNADPKDTHHRGEESGLNVMGMYKNLNATGVTTKTAQLSVQGVANKTASLLLSGYKYDPTQTAALKLPANGTIQGAAFKKNTDFVYVLWARTSVDNSENASANYSFPLSMGIAQIKRAEWDYSSTKATTDILTSSVTLSGAPIFLFGGSATVGVADDFLDENSNILWTYQDGSDESTHIYLNLNVKDNVTVEIYNTAGTRVKALIETEDLSAGLTTYEIKNDEYDKGLYICKAVGHFGTSISKFVIK